MNHSFLKFISLICIVISSAAFAADGKITITAPMDGAMLSINDKVKVSYEADPGSTGDHLHLYVDGKRVDVLRQLKGTADAGKLMAGKHKVCLEINTKAHVSTGVENCVNITVQ